MNKYNHKYNNNNNTLWDLKVTLFSSQKILRGFLFVCLYRKEIKRELQTVVQSFYNVWKKKQSHEKRRNHHVRSRTFWFCFQTIQKTERGGVLYINTGYRGTQTQIKLRAKCTLFAWLHDKYHS